MTRATLNHYGSTTKRGLVSLLDELDARGWNPGEAAGMDRATVCEWYADLIHAGLRSKTLPLACVVVELLAARRPDTVRGIMYAVVSAGWLPDTSVRSYRLVQRILNTLRKKRVIPFDWVVDNIRETRKPSSWTGLDDFADTVSNVYRKDFWAQLDEHICIIVEKDTVAGRIWPVTDEYDVALHALRGFSSTTFASEIGLQWATIERPITAYFIGDHDPSGLGIETSINSPLRDSSGRDDFRLKRLAVLPEHFDTFDIRPLKPKEKDTRAKRFVAEYGERCAEVEAIPADELRLMVRDAIESHIPWQRWERLKEIEQHERESWHEVMSKIRGNL
jgi:hypothetical protein